MALFFLVMLLIGRYILINLIVAIMLDKFSKLNSVASCENLLEQSKDLVCDGASKLDPPDQKSNANVQRQPFRDMCRFLASHPVFDWVIIVAVLVSSTALAFDNPRLDPESSLAQLLRASDPFWAAIFLAELCIKASAFGFCRGENAYIKSAWNQLDLAILIVTILVLVAETFPVLQPLKTLRVLRVLRPLRLISRNSGMRLIMTTIIKVAPVVGNVFGVVLMLQTVFAVIGMQIFAGRMGSCSNPAISTQAACFDGDSTRRALKGGGVSVTWTPGDPVVWHNPRQGSFDDFGSAMRLLYVMGSGDGWEYPMYAMMSATIPGKAPVRDDYSPAALFSIAWVVLGSFFSLNLLVGAMVDEFNRIKRREDTSATMTAEQTQWIETMKSITRQGAIQQPPTHWARRALFDIVTSRAFEGVVMACILLNAVAMACDSWQLRQDAYRSELFSGVMIAFNYIYYTEASCKLFAMGGSYFADPWNRFDFVLVCQAALDQLAAALHDIMPFPPTLARVIRLARILRILRIFKTSMHLRKLVNTLLYAFPALINITSLLALVTFIYGVLGVNLFTFLATQDRINEMCNFEHLGSAGLLLFQCLTMDGWSELMADAMVQEESGRCSDAEGTCGGLVAIPYFISFQVIASMIILNLVIAVILDHFSSLGSRDGLVSDVDIDLFKEAWMKCDSLDLNCILIAELPKLLTRVPAPLGFLGDRNPKSKAIRRCMQLNMTSHEGKLAFKTVIEALINYNFRSERIDTAPGMQQANDATMLPSNSPGCEDDHESLADRHQDDDAVKRAFAYTVIGNKLKTNLRLIIGRKRARDHGYVHGAGPKEAALLLASVRQLQATPGKAEGVALLASVARLQAAPEEAALLESVHRLRKKYAHAFAVASLPDPALLPPQDPLGLVLPPQTLEGKQLCSRGHPRELI